MQHFENNLCLRLNITNHYDNIFIGIIRYKVIILNVLPDKSFIRVILIHRIASVFPDRYDRLSMGGYILLFQTASEFATILPILSQEYHFDTDLYEYDDPIEGTCWNSRLYLISSDDALMMVYPAE